jgi:hypothetical protein
LKYDNLVKLGVITIGIFYVYQCVQVYYRILRNKQSSAKWASVRQIEGFGFSLSQTHPIKKHRASCFTVPERRGSGGEKRLLGKMTIFG